MSGADFIVGAVRARPQRRARQLLLLPLVAAVGAGSAGSLLAVVAGPLAQRSPGLQILIAVQIVCFVPLGLLLGLSIAHWSEGLRVHARALIILSMIGVTVYASLSSILGILGGVVGLALLGTSLVGILERRLSRRSALGPAVGTAGMIALLMTVMQCGDVGFLIAAAGLHPFGAILGVGMEAVLYLSAVFYVFDVLLLAGLPSDSG